MIALYCLVSAFCWEFALVQGDRAASIFRIVWPIGLFRFCSHFVVASKLLNRSSTSNDWLIPWHLAAQFPTPLHVVSIV